MKTHIQMLILAVFALAFPAFALAADSTGDVAAASTPWQLALIPVLTPIIIAGVKWLMLKISTTLIPILAPILGMALDLILHFSTGTELNVWLAMGLGLAGVGVREVLDQLKQSAAG